MATRKNPGAFGKPAHQRPVDRPTATWQSPEGNTIIMYYDGKGD